MTDSIGFLTTLESIIRDRLADGSEQSYTAGLVAEGTQRVAQKVGEEGLELALAAVIGSREEQLNEAADLIYHILVLLQAQGLALSDVAGILEARHRNR
ncbi:MAG: phosphoribosyl-ATP diphosphatase [Pseudomonadota bacterium]